MISAITTIRFGIQQRLASHCFIRCFSYSIYFLAGFTDTTMRNPGFILVSVLLLQIGVPQAITQRIFLILLIIGFFYIPIGIVKLINPEQKGLFFFGFYIFLGGIWIKLMLSGQLPFLTSVILSFYGVIYFFHLISNHVKSIIPYVLDGILFGLAIFFEFVTMIIVGLILITYLLYQRNYVLKNIKQFIQILVLLVLGILMLLCSWLLPVLYYGLIQKSDISFIEPWILNNSPIALDFQNLLSVYNTFHLGLFLNLIPFFIWPMIIIGLYYGLKGSNLWERVFDYALIVIFGFILITYFIPSFNLITTTRFLVYVEMLLVVPFLSLYA